jgi:hypothetical protein
MSIEAQHRSLADTSPRDVISKPHPGLRVPVLQPGSTHNCVACCVSCSGLPGMPIFGVGMPTLDGIMGVLRTVAGSTSPNAGTCARVQPGRDCHHKAQGFESAAVANALLGQLSQNASRGHSEEYSTVSVFKDCASAASGSNVRVWVAGCRQALCCAVDQHA